MSKMKALFIGECMVELSSLESGLLQKSFAGDVFNSAVYMKRFVGNACNVSLLTAIGEDSISNEMEVFFEKHGLLTDHVFKSSNGTVGLYLISTDDDGERHFSYWRDNSVARHLMDILAQNIKLISDIKADMIFFTGITLAILNDESRRDLIAQLTQARKKGAKIAFDPNYRHQLWENKESAADWITKAYDISDYIFPSLAEEEMLFGIKSVEECLDKFQAFEHSEIVLKAGNEGMLVKYDEELFHQEFVPVKNVVDTTAAGDSFDGTYLAARLTGVNIENSLSKAASIAAKVVQYPGAIIPETLTG